MSVKPAESDILRLADEWIAAELRGEVTFLEQTLADDFAAVGPLGFTLTKQEWVGRHQTGNMKYSSLTLTEATARIYDGTAVVIGRQSQDATYQGNSVKAELRVTAVLVNQEGKWRLVGVHMSPIGQPPALPQQRESA